MNRRSVFAPLAAAALTTVATPASARPMTSCHTLEERMVAAYDTYQEDKNKYGSNDRRTEQAYDNYEKAKQAYSKFL